MSNTDENKTLTDEQVQAVYASLDKVENTDKMPEFNEPIIIDDPSTVSEVPTTILGGIDTALADAYIDGDIKEVADDKDPYKDIEISDKNIKTAIDSYSEQEVVNDQEALSLIDLLTYYRDNKDNEHDDFKYYDKLPTSFKIMADANRTQNGVSIPKETAARMVLDFLLNDAAQDGILEQYEKEIKAANAELENGLSDLYNKAIVENAAKFREKISESNPDFLNRYDANVAYAYSFERQKEWISKMPLKKINKLHWRYNDNARYLDQLIKRAEEAFKIKIVTRTRGERRSTAERIIEVISRLVYTTEYQLSEETAQKFVLSIEETVRKLALDDIFDVVYFYNLIAVILRYEFKPVDSEDDNIIIDRIRNICIMIDNKE